MTLKLLGWNRVDFFAWLDARKAKDDTTVLSQGSFRFKIASSCLINAGLHILLIVTHSAMSCEDTFSGGYVCTDTSKE